LRNNGDAIDVSGYPTYGGAYILPEGVFKEGKDYCDAKRERWIWSSAGGNRMAAFSPR
jgi:hypothetical protein